MPHHFVEESPLFDSDFENVATESLKEAVVAWITNYDKEETQRLLKMNLRFFGALRKRMMGVTSIKDLGLELDDLLWGANKQMELENGDSELRFRTAAMRLESVLQQK